MADMFLVSATIIRWKVGSDGKAAFESSSEPVSNIFEAETDDQIKLKLLAGLLIKDKANLDTLLGKMVEGLLTVEILNRNPVKVPAIPETEARKEAIKILGEVLAPLAPAKKT